MTQNELIRSAGRAAAFGVGAAAATYAAYVGTTWLRYGNARPAVGHERDSLLDSIMPTYEVAERHRVFVHAPADVTFAVSCSIDLDRSAIVRAIFKGRELVLGGRSQTESQPTGLLAAMTGAGWGVLTEVPNREIVMGSVTGEQEVLSFDPFDSFAHIDKAFAAWGGIYASHPDLGKAQAQITGALVSQRTIVAVRRDDLSYRPDRIDLSKARFLRVLEVRLHPGHEGQFAEAFQKLGAAYEKTDSDLPWVVYQVNVGMPSPTFFAFVPMKTLAQNDDLLNRRDRLREAEGDAAERMQQIAREAYVHTESNLYAVSPEKSHVSKEFAAGDPKFWTPKVQAPVEATVRKSKAKQ